jgi:hypothetical protein
MKHSKTASRLALSLCAAFAVPAAQAALEVEGSASIASRYVAEGMDVDPDSSAFFLGEVTATVEAFTFGVFYAQSLRRSSTNEINLFAEFGFGLGDVDLFAGINYLTFPAGDDADTWEFYVGFEYELNPNVVFFGETYYDFDEVRGGFLELGVAFPFSPMAGDENWELAPYVQLGVDYGFVSGPRRLRENNFQIGLLSTYALSDNAELFAGIHHSFRLKNLRDEGEGDVTWVEAGVSFAF